MTMTSGARLRILLALLLGAGTSIQAAAEDLTVVNYGGGIQDWSRTYYWKPFAAETGIKVIEDTRDYGIGIIRTKVAGGANIWDVVAAEDIEVIQGCEEGLFQKLDWSKIANKDKLLPQAVLPCAQGEVIYDMMIAYDGKRITGDGPRNWVDFWNTKKWPGKRVLYKDPRDSLEAALMADGIARDQVYRVLATPAGVDRAFRKLGELKPNLLWWSNPGQSRQMLISGDAVMAATFGGGLLLLNRKEHTDFKLVWTDAILHTDYWAIVKGTPHLAAAMQYLNFVSRADRQAAFAKEALQGVPNRDVDAMIDKALFSDLVTAPNNLKVALTSSAPFWLEHYDTLNQRFTAWLSQ
jgi:putative spermidine/putrescine transport system substrate-binding protein